MGTGENEFSPVPNSLTMGIKEEKRKLNNRKRRQRYYRIAAVILAVLVLIGIIFGIRALVRAVSGASDSASSREEEVDETADDRSAEAEGSTEAELLDSVVKKFFVSGTESADTDDAKPITITASFMGDCTLGRDTGLSYSRSLDAYYDNYGPDYFFQNVRSILEEDDISVVNMEGTLTTETDREDKTYAFKGDPDYVEILTDGSVEAANLANNHAYDYGDQSHLDTIDALDEADVANFGYEDCALVEVKGVQIGFSGICCYGNFGLGDTPEPEERLKMNIDALQKAGAQIIIASFHWGIEGEHTPTEEQVDMAHLAIDYGADLVIGHHPHVLQGIEKYKGKYIAYSLGNFCFGGNSNPSDKDTMILQETFTLETDGSLDISQVEAIPCSLSSTSGKNDYCPTPLTGEEAQRVLDKIAAYSEDLSTNPEASAGRAADTSNPDDASDIAITDTDTAQ